MSTASSSPEEHPSTPPNWLDLPEELTMEILRRLEVIEILEVVQRVCVTWRDVCKDKSMWRSIDMYNIFDTDSYKEIMCRMYNIFDLTSYMEKMCRDAVDRSCGCLNDITLRGFGSVALLIYIADRAPQLRRLRLFDCHTIHTDLLYRVAKRLSNLEELHIFNVIVTKHVIKHIGHCSPQLKSFTYNLERSHIPHLRGANDGVALAIAQTMSGLRHLSLSGTLVTEDGLQAILDQCPHLESLDIRMCFHVNLEGDFGRTCAQRIKNLKLPSVFIDPYE